jgi:predicted O-methyltransferase YrrM
MSHFALWCLGLASATTQTTPEERDCLARHASLKKRLVELGVWQGVTTCRLRAAMAPDATLFAVDPYPVGRLGFSTHQVIAHREVSKQRNGRVDWVRLPGAEAARRHRERGEPPIDFIFIDGDHSYEGLREDWEGWSPLVAPGGIVALHDSRSSELRNIDDAGSVRFTQEVILRAPDFQVVDALHSLTVLRRSTAA